MKLPLFFAALLLSGVAHAQSAGPRIYSAVSGLIFPLAVTTGNGNVYIADRGAHTVWKYDPRIPALTPFAGTGQVKTQTVLESGELAVTLAPGLAGYSGDGTATAAQLNAPSGVALDANGNVYIADTENNLIRKVPTLGPQAGVMSTVAGTWPTRGSTGNGGPATLAALAGPRGMSVDPSGNLYIADSLNQQIRKVTVATGVISVVAGVAGATGYLDSCFIECPANPPDPLFNAPLGAAAFSFEGPSDITVYVADEGNRAIRRINDSNGFVDTYRSGLGAPSAITVDANGYAVFPEPNRHVVRRFDGESLTTIAGLPDESGFAGDGGFANVATFNRPVGIALDLASGAIYVVDLGNRRLRKIQ